MTADKPDRRPVGRPLIGDRRMTNAEYLRRYRAKKALLIVHKHCSNPDCNKRLRRSSRLDICRACWLKTDDGREYMRLKKIESRSKRNHE
jgi:hypothetical protein